MHKKDFEGGTSKSLHLLQKNGFAENILRKLSSNEQVSSSAIRSHLCLSFSADSSKTQLTFANVANCKLAKTNNKFGIIP